MKPRPGTAPAASGARQLVRWVWRGLIEVLVGPDVAPAWWRPPWQRWAYVALGVATLVLGAGNLASVHAQPTVAGPAPASSCRVPLASPSITRRLASGRCC